jgi:hypothetical protein
VCQCVSSRNLKNYAAPILVGLLRQRQKILFSKHRPSSADPAQLAGTLVPWAFDVRYLDLLIDSKLLYNKHLRTVTKTAKGVFVMSSLYSLKTPRFHRKLKQPSASLLSDPLWLTSLLAGVPNVSQTTSNSRSSKTGADDKLAIIPRARNSQRGAHSKFHSPTNSQFFFPRPSHPYTRLKKSEITSHLSESDV